MSGSAGPPAYPGPDSRWGHRQGTGRPRYWVAPAWSLWTLLVVVAFGVLRNVPGFEALAP